MPLGMSKNAWLNTGGSLTNIVKENLVFLLDAGNLSSYSGGTTWYDLSQNQNDATLVGSPAFNLSRNGCFFLRGTASSQYATISHDASSMDFSDQQTICMWLLPEGGSNTKRRNPYNQAFGGPGTLTYETGGTINYYFGTNGGNSTPYVNRNSGFTVSEGELAFIAVTRNQTTNQTRWYKNGSLVTSGNAGGYASTANGSNPILIGDGYVDGFLGNIYFCAVYNRALSAAEVEQNYEALLGRYQDVYTGWQNFGFGLQSEGLNYYDIFDAVDYTSTDGGSLVFNGTTNSYINFNANIGGATTVSVEMWVKPNLSSNVRMFFGWNSYDVFYSNSLGYNTANGDIYGITSGSVSGLALNGSWKHYVFEMRSDVSYTNNKIYIDGVSQTLSQQLGSESSGNRNFNSGNGRISGWLTNTSYRMPMNLSTFRVYPRALSQSEIDEKYEEFSARFRGLVLHLDAGDVNSYPGSGTTWYDISGNGLNATLVNGPTYDSADGGSIVFDGSNDYASISDNILLDITSEITQEVWVYLDSYTDRATLSSKVYSYYLQITTDGTVQVYTYYNNDGTRGTSSYDSSTASVSLNEWTQVVFTEDTSGLRKIYINGELDSSHQAEASIWSDTQPLKIGGEFFSPSPNERKLDGKISCVKIYNRALSSTEVSQNFNALRGRYGI